MYRNKLFWFTGLLVVLGMAIGVARPAAAGSQWATAGGHRQGGTIHVVRPIRHDISAPLRTLKGHPLTREQLQALKLVQRMNTQPAPKVLRAAGQSTGSASSIVQKEVTVASVVPTPSASFDGLSNAYNVSPPDTNGDVGYNPTTGKKYYFQVVNVDYAVWDVTDPANPIQVIAPTANNAMWSGFGGACETHNDGDAVVLFDHLANRWLFSQFALDFTNNRFYQCIAVSAGADPTSSWYRYEYQIPSNLMNDYPKFGVWPDAYYMSANQFQYSNGALYSSGVGAFAFERSEMLKGGAARMIYINVGNIAPDYFSMLPADLDGQAPPAGTPEYFIEWDDSTWLGDPTDTLRIWEFHVDWATPANTTFGANSAYDPNYKIATSDVDPNMCGFSRNCIPQPNTTEGLDAVSDRLMYRAAFRVWSDGSFSIVSNHTVDVDGSDHAGIHWFDLKWDGTTWSLAQEGVYAPDAANRWMGSVALDASHDIALGYSVASGSVYPSVRFTGRLASDTAGQMRSEGTFVDGGGSQTDQFYHRWGDYSMMSIDPVDDCTFWYTQEYYPYTSTSTWHTRIGAFKFGGICVTAPRATLSGTVTDLDTGMPIGGATVELPDYGYTTTTDSNGHYTFTNVLPNTYQVTVYKPGYAQNSATVTLTGGTSTTQNFQINVGGPPLLLGDFNGDGTTDIAIFRPSDSSWHIRGVGAFTYGASGDTPVPADYNGDGKDEIAVFRASNNTWYIHGVGHFQYGSVGDLPVVGDYNGDGKADIAVFRSSNSTWYIRGAGHFQYGTAGDIPVPADYNGDGKTDIAVFRPADNTWHIFGIGAFTYGTAGDIPVPGDYNGDGKADIAVFRPSNHTWYLRGMSHFVYGTAGDIPVPGDYNGDGKTDIAVFRPSNGTWYIHGMGAVVFGSGSDIPGMPQIIPGMHP